MRVSVPVKILIVEDSEDDALLITDELRETGGFEPTFERVENSGQLADALERAWDVIIADYRMPGFSGMDALKFVRERDPDVPFIVVSGQISEETAVEAMRAGAQDYVLKDNLARLPAAIDRELRDARVRRERRQAQEDLARSEQTLQSIIDSSNAAIYLKDVDGSYILVNNQTARILKTTKEGAIGKTVHDFIPKHMADNTSAHDREVIANCAAQEYEETVETEQGIRTFLTARFPVYDSAGTIYGVGGISTDVTESVRMRQELQSALEREKYFSLLLQRALLPAMPEIGQGYEVAAEYVPAQGGEIGGDFYDVFRVSQGKAGVLIGDVSGKGLEAAAMAATTRSTIHAFVHETASPAEALARANSVMYSRQTESEAFATVFLIIIDLATGEMSYSSAGHPPPVLCRRNGAFEYLEFGPAPLAVLDSQEFHEHTCMLEPGDRLLLYTDGISESRRGDDLFDHAGIERFLLGCCSVGIEKLARDLINEATEWAYGTLRDDAAVVAVERHLT